jgi:hypothetical protein
MEGENIEFLSIRKHQWADSISLSLPVCISSAKKIWNDKGTATSDGVWGDEPQTCLTLAFEFRSIDKLRNLRPNRDDCRVPTAEKGQHLQAPTASSIHIVLSGSSSVLNRANLFAATRTRRLKMLQQLAEACRSRVLGRSRMRHPVDNGYIRPSALPLTLQIPPPLTESQHALRQASPNDETTDTLLPECKAVAEFLAAQLSLFADSLTQGHQRAVENRTAALASHQIWRDQQRALADCELNLTRCVLAW